MNNHFYEILIRSAGEIHKFAVKKGTNQWCADSMQEAANWAIRKARTEGLDSPSIIEVQEKLLTSPQVEIPS